jgi:hypothetical protein
MPSLANRYGDQAEQPDLTLPDIPAERVDIQMPTDANDTSAVGRAFAASRAEARQFRQLAQTLRSKLEAAYGSQTATTQKQEEMARQLAEAQAQTKALENEIGKLDLRRSPEFIQKYDMPIAGIRDQLAEEFAKHGVTPDDAMNLAVGVLDAENSEQVQEVVSSLPPAIQGMAMYKYAEADRLFAERGQALDAWRETQAGLEQVERRETPVLTAQHRETLCNSGFDRVARVVQFWDDPAFQSYREREAPNVRSWFGQAPEDQVVAAAVEGALVAPFAYNQIRMLQNENAQLKQALEGRVRIAAPTVAPYFKSAPVPPPPAPATPQPTQSDLENPLDFASRLIRDAANNSGIMPRMS